MDIYLFNVCWYKLEISLSVIYKFPMCYLVPLYFFWILQKRFAVISCHHSDPHLHWGNFGSFTQISKFIFNPHINFLNIFVTPGIFHLNYIFWCGERYLIHNCFLTHSSTSIFLGLSVFSPNFVLKVQESMPYDTNVI